MKVIRRKDKFYINDKKIGPFSSKKEAENRLKQILSCQQTKSDTIELIESLSTTIKKKGMVHISDALVSCASLISSEASKDNIIIGLCKIISLLRNKGENDISEKLNNIIPDILGLEKCGSKIMKINQSGVPADKVYRMVIKLHEKYITGLIDDGFEYKKMKELKDMLKNGFELPAPNNVKIPKGVNNWWEYFSKRGK